jgi:hypothetical protein
MFTKSRENRALLVPVNLVVLDVMSIVQLPSTFVFDDRNSSFSNNVYAKYTDSNIDASSANICSVENVHCVSVNGVQTEGEKNDPFIRVLKVQLDHKD